MKSTTLYRFNPLLLKPDATEGGKKDTKAPEGKDAPATEKKEEKAADKPEDKKPEEELEKLSPEELKKRQRELKEVSRSGGRRKTEQKKEEKAEEKKVEPKPEEKSGDKKEEKVEEAPKPPSKPPEKKTPPTPRADVPPPIDETDVAKPSAPVEFETKLPLRNADKRKLQVLKQMEEDNTAPKGTAEKTLRFWEKEAEYQERWEAAHPGEAFDENADEHKVFYERNEVTYDTDEYENSRDNLVKKETLKETEGKQTQENKKAKRVQEFREAQKRINEDSQDAVMDMIESAAPELAELMGKDGERALSKEVTEKMIAKDPVVTEILQETAEALAVLTIELHRLTQFDDVYPIDPTKSLPLNVSGRRIHPHAELVSFMHGLEVEMLKMPPDQTMRGKQRLVSNTAFEKEYNRIAGNAALDGTAKKEAVAKLNASYYTLTEEDFRRGLIAQYADSAKREIEKFTKRAGHRTPAKPDAGAKPPQAEEKKEEKVEEKVVEEEVPVVERRRSPSSASASDAVDPGGKTTATQTVDAKSAVGRSRGR